MGDASAATPAAAHDTAWQNERPIRCAGPGPNQPMAQQDGRAGRVRPDPTPPARRGTALPAERRKPPAETQTRRPHGPQGGRLRRSAHTKNAQAACPPPRARHSVNHARGGSAVRCAKHRACADRARSARRLRLLATQDTDSHRCARNSRSIVQLNWGRLLNCQYRLPQLVRAASDGEIPCQRKARDRLSKLAAQSSGLMTTGGRPRHRRKARPQH